MSLSYHLQRWMKQHREEKEKEEVSDVAMETSDVVKAPLSSDEHDKENLHTLAPGVCVCNIIDTRSLWIVGEGG